LVLPSESENNVAQFVLVISDVPTAGFDKIMNIVSDSAGGIRFIPNKTNSNEVNTEGMHGPDPKGMYSCVRLEFQHPSVEKAAAMLKIFEGLPAKPA
jgi:hypothetical protein